MPEMRERRGRTGFLGLLSEDLQEELNGCRPRPAADGRTGIGKTTVIPAGRRPTEGRLEGFYIQEIRERGERHGFRLVGFDRTKRVIAHVDFPKVHRVGRYGFDVGIIHTG